MPSATVTTDQLRSFRTTWGAGMGGGFVGGVAMGLILHGGANLMPFIGALYGWPTVTGGWVAHLLNSVVLGVLFAVLLALPFLREQTTSVEGCVLAGVVYAAGISVW